MLTRRTSGIFAVILCALLATATPAIRADNTNPTPDAVFRADGLVRLGKWLVLQDEIDLHARVWALQQSDEAVRTSTTSHRSLQPELLRGIHVLDDLANQRDDLQKTIDGLKDKKDDDSIDAYNSAVMQSDELWSKAINEEETLNGLFEREGQVEQARARFIGGVMDMQAKADAIALSYSSLARDAALKAAVAQANADADPPLSLGPSARFADDQEFVRQSAQKIVSAWVAVQKSGVVGAVHVRPILNGKLTVSMTWDSGCSYVRLSSRTAAELGLKLTDANPSTEAIIANGTKIKGKLAMLDSVQLGAFTMHDILCDVSQDDKDSSIDNLLGNSFQSHFLSRLDQQGGRLQLTPIDSSVDIGAQSEPQLTITEHATVPQNRPVERPKDFNLARLATATASSTLDGASPRGAIDGIIAGAPESPRNEWACDQTSGSITLAWDQPLAVSSAKLWDRVNGIDHITSGQLVFSDGSTVPFGELPTDKTPLNLQFAPRTVSWIRFEILTVGPQTHHPGFAEIFLFQ